ncbi:MAG: endonuclease III [Rickettsiales bacterium]|nr:endonuclease III [Rickettsiales bacterium]
MMQPGKYFNAIWKQFGADCLTELYHTNEFTLAVAVILSAQATDKHVNTVTPGLFAVADTPAKMTNLGIAELKEFIKSISFFNNKAKNIIALSEILTGSGDCYYENSAEQSCSNWRFPAKYHSRDALMMLPGIGQKTANVVSNILWGAPNIGVDTHLFRLSHRFGWADGADDTPEKVESKLLARIPKKYHAIANHAMVMHGRYICKALRPDCGNCPVALLCDSKDKKLEA